MSDLGNLFFAAPSQFGPNDVPVVWTEALPCHSTFAVLLKSCSELVIAGLASITHVLDVTQRKTALVRKSLALLLAKFGEVYFEFVHTVITLNSVVLVNTI